LPHQRLLLEEKLSPKVTDEVLPQYDFAENFLENTLPAAHLIRPCGAPSPPGEGFSGCVANLKQLDKPEFEGHSSFIIYNL